MYNKLGSFSNLNPIPNRVFSFSFKIIYYNTIIITFIIIDQKISILYNTYVNIEKYNIKVAVLNVLLNNNKFQKIKALAL